MNDLLARLQLAAFLAYQCLYFALNPRPRR